MSAGIHQRKLSKRAWLLIVLVAVVVNLGIYIFTRWDAIGTAAKAFEICNSRFPLTTQPERLQICYAEESLFIKKHAYGCGMYRKKDARDACVRYFIDNFAAAIDKREAARREKEKKQEQETVEKLKELGACGSGTPRLECWPAGTAIGH